MYWDRFDIVAAYYAYSVEWHGGQWSALYELSCRIGKYYTPGIMDNGSESLNENARVIYDSLVERGYLQ